MNNTLIGLLLTGAVLGGCANNDPKPCTRDHLDYQSEGFDTRTVWGYNGSKFTLTKQYGDTKDTTSSLSVKYVGTKKKADVRVTTWKLELRQLLHLDTNMKKNLPFVYKK